MYELLQTLDVYPAKASPSASDALRVACECTEFRNQLEALDAYLTVDADECPEVGVYVDADVVIPGKSGLTTAALSSEAMRLFNNVFKAVWEARTQPVSGSTETLWEQDDFGSSRERHVNFERAITPAYFFECRGQQEGRVDAPADFLMAQKALERCTVDGFEEFYATMLRTLKNAVAIHADAPKTSPVRLSALRAEKLLKTLWVESGARDDVRYLRAFQASSVTARARAAAFVGRLGAGLDEAGEAALLADKRVLSHLAEMGYVDRATRRVNAARMRLDAASEGALYKDEEWLLDLCIALKLTADGMTYVEVE